MGSTHAIYPPLPPRAQKIPRNSAMPVLARCAKQYVFHCFVNIRSWGSKWGHRPDTSKIVQFPWKHVWFLHFRSTLKFASFFNSAYDSPWNLSIFIINKVRSFLPNIETLALPAVTAKIYPWCDVFPTSSSWESVSAPMMRTTILTNCCSHQWKSCHFEKVRVGPAIHLLFRPHFSALTAVAARK